MNRWKPVRDMIAMSEAVDRMLDESLHNRIKPKPIFANQN